MKKINNLNVLFEFAVRQTSDKRRLLVLHEKILNGSLSERTKQTARIKEEKKKRK